MKMPDGGFRPAYNVQLATDAASRVIVGARVVNVGSDVGQLTPMLDEIKRHTGRVPAEHLVDGGFVNLDAFVAAEAGGVTIYAPVMTPAHPRAPGARARRVDPPAVARWRRRMDYPEAKAIYRHRGRDRRDDQRRSPTVAKPRPLSGPGAGQGPVPRAAERPRAQHQPLAPAAGCLKADVARLATANRVAAVPSASARRRHAPDFAPGEAEKILSLSGMSGGTAQAASGGWSSHAASWPGSTQPPAGAQASEPGQIVPSPHVVSLGARQPKAASASPTAPLTTARRCIGEIVAQGDQAGGRGPCGRVTVDPADRAVPLRTRRSLRDLQRRPRGLRGRGDEELWRCGSTRGVRRRAHAADHQVGQRTDAPDRQRDEQERPPGQPALARVGAHPAERKPEGDRQVEQELDAPRLALEVGDQLQGPPSDQDPHGKGREDHEYRCGEPGEATSVHDRTVCGGARPGHYLPGNARALGARYAGQRWRPSERSCEPGV
jgi:hypothetical protein